MVQLPPVSDAATAAVVMLPDERICLLLLTIPVLSPARKACSISDSIICNSSKTVRQ